MHKTHKTNLTNTTLAKTLLVISLTATGMLGLTGCQTMKSAGGKFFGKDKSETVATAEKSEQAYYQEASKYIAEKKYVSATNSLKDLRVFYPTGRYAQQALLDLMYVQYNNKKYEEAGASAKQFITLYPSNPQVDYAYYVRGVSSMAGKSDSIKLFKKNQSERDTAIYRSAFASFSELVNKFPNSIYAPDAAQRMTYIYNQFAEHELHIARWYVERKAYVAAANRAKWIFQYYPKSESVPEAIATLAYCYDKLGMTNLATEYKILLQINYPQWLTAKGKVKLKGAGNRSLVNKLTLGKLDRSSDSKNRSVTGKHNNNYKAQTKTQVIKQINQLQLPAGRN